MSYKYFETKVLVSARRDRSMSSHAGRWNIERMSKLRMILDDFPSILLAPICKGDHANINLMGIADADSDHQVIDIIQIARTSMIKPETKAKGLIRYDREGVFNIKAYDEDAIYGMAAVLSVMGTAVFMPKLIVTPAPPKNGWRDKYRVKMLEFTPRVEFADAKIVSIDMRHALTFATEMTQPDFEF